MKVVKIWNSCRDRQCFTNILLPYWSGWWGLWCQPLARSLCLCFSAEERPSSARPGAAEGPQTSVSNWSPRKIKYRQIGHVLACFSIITFNQPPPTPPWKMLTKVKFSKAALSTGAEGMPIMDAIVTSFVFPGELSCKVWRKEIT